MDHVTVTVAFSQLIGVVLRISPDSNKLFPRESVIRSSCYCPILNRGIFPGFKGKKNNKTSYADFHNRGSTRSYLHAAEAH